MGSTEQTKTGNLIIEGVLRLGQFATAPSGTEGALYFDTTENTIKIYSNSAWSDLGGGAEPGQLPTYTTAQRDALSPTAGLQIYNTTENNVQLYSQTAWKTVGAKLALAAVCSLDGDCDSTHCVDGVCCDVAPCPTCQACNLAGAEGSCSDVADGTYGFGCTSTHYRCNGLGDCTAPTEERCVYCNVWNCAIKCSQIGAINCLRMGPNCALGQWWPCDQIGNWEGTDCACTHYVYD